MPFGGVSLDVYRVLSIDTGPDTPSRGNRYSRHRNSESTEAFTPPIQLLTARPQAQAEKARARVKRELKGKTKPQALEAAQYVVLLTTTPATHPEEPEGESAPVADDALEGSQHSLARYRTSALLPLELAVVHRLPQIAVPWE